PEASAVDGHDRAMTAQVLAAAAGLRVAHGARLAVRVVQVRVAGQRRQVVTFGHDKSLPGERDYRLRLNGSRAGGVLKALEHADESFFKLAAQYCVGAQPAQQVFVDRSIQAIEAQVRQRVELSDGGQDLDREARRGVHGDVESDQVRLAHRLLAQRLAREVQTRYPGAGAPQPRRRR